MAAVAFAISSLNAAGITSVIQNTSFNAKTNLTITHLLIPANVSQYAPLQISFNVTNVGNFAAQNVFVDLHIYGAHGFNSTYNLNPLSPAQSELVTIYLSNATNVTGSYIAYLNSGYVSANNTYITGKTFAGYAVVQSGIGNPSELNSANTLPEMYILSMPAISYQLPQSTVLSQLQLSYNGTRPAIVDFSVPSSFSNLISFTSSSLYWLRNGTLGVGIALNPQGHSPEFSYIAPVTLTETTNNDLVKSSITKYIQLYIINGSDTYAMVSHSIVLLNGSTSASGTLQLNSPANYSVNNVNLGLVLPASVAPNISDINAYGAASNITQSDGEYSLVWNLGSVKPNQNVYVYYTVKRLSQVSALQDSRIGLYATTAPNSKGIFKVINTLLPVLYSNGTGKVKVDILYTGTSSGIANFYLSSTPNATVHDATQSVQVSPNQEIERSFNITVNNFAGTIVFRLAASVNGQNLTYNLPVVVLERQRTLPEELSGFLSTFKYLILAIIIVVVIVVLRIGVERRKPIAYNPERGRTLINIRNQMKRGE
ncbi:MAG: hypothetical protein KGH64_02640 [Candidatus Micrarchaeota archaeon]|nr:hypothetical protein [Candidatus Micrarchaeota archaeon]MDE1834210.1 hypothetical protein [Candidatus Micrarchaeota archaeon]MDE1859738.1 hypothetical protein [Candidatus Micrarchaeota archaeon]